MFAYDFPERDRRRVVAGRRERSSRWRWHCPHRNLHLCHCCMRSTEMADKGLLSTILGMPRSTCAAAQIIPRGVKTIAEYARLSSSFTSSSTPSAHVTLGWALRSSPIKWCGGVACSRTQPRPLSLPLWSRISGSVWSCSGFNAHCQQ